MQAATKKINEDEIFKTLKARFIAVHRSSSRLKNIIFCVWAAVLYLQSKRGISSSGRAQAWHV